MSIASVITFGTDPPMYIPFRLRHFAVVIVMSQDARTGLQVKITKKFYKQIVSFIGSVRRPCKRTSAMSQEKTMNVTTRMGARAATENSLQ